nr:hypothetical protein [Tanacetum cinerariifolium]
MKAKLALLEATPSSSHNPKTFQPKNKGLVAEPFDWDEEEVFDEEEVTQVKKVSQCINEKIPHRKKKVLGGQLFNGSSFKMNENEKLFVPASIGYDQEMVLKTKDWVERLNPDSKLPNFNTRRILVPKSQAVNESFESTEILNTLESSKDSEAESLALLPPLKNLLGASPSSKLMPLTFQPHSPKERPGLDEKVTYNQKTQELNSKIQNTESSKSVDSSRISQDFKPKVQNTSSSKSLRPKHIKKPQFKTSDNAMYIASLKRSENYKAWPYEYASSSKQIMKAKTKLSHHAHTMVLMIKDMMIVETTLNVEFVETIITILEDTIMSFRSEEEY